MSSILSDFLSIFLLLPLLSSVRLIGKLATPNARPIKAVAYPARDMGAIRASFDIKTL